MTQNRNYSVGRVSVSQVDVLAICSNVFVLEYDNYNNYWVEETSHAIFS